MGELLTFDYEKCARDGLCSTVCPVVIIESDEEKKPRTIERREKGCILCGHCVAICPKDAIYHAKLENDVLVRIKKEFSLSKEQLDQLLRGRRSIRTFKDDPLEQDVVMDCLQTTSYAPSGHNMRPVSWVVLANRNRVVQFMDVLVAWMRKERDQETELANALNLKGVVRAWENGVDYISRGAPQMVIGHAPKQGITPQEDCIIAATYLELALWGKGFGSCWAGYVTLGAKQDPAIAHWLNIPDEHGLFSAHMVGKPTYTFRSIPSREAPPVLWMD